MQRVWLKGDNEHNWIIAFLATLVALLLAPPVKNAVQNVLDRAFYRDRYDYRRALVGFARDLNSDLDLHRLSERLVSRVVETLLVDRMALMLEDEAAPYYGSVRASGFGDSHPPALPKRSGIGERLEDGHIVALDDPIASTRFAVEEVEYWRDAGLYYFVPCLAKEGTIAVLAVGRKDTGEPLNSEDMGLLGAVAGQIATALENARLYRQLHVKALELDRMRAFNENILESLDDGLLVLDLNDRVVRWNPAMEALSAVSKGDATGRRLDDLFDAPFVEARPRGAPRRAAGRDAVAPSARTPWRRGIAADRECGRGSAARGRRERHHHGRHHRHHRRRHAARATRGAAPDFREDGVDRPAGGRRRPRGEHAADRHLELHADAARRRRSRRPEDEGAREDRAPDVPRREDRQRPPEPVAAWYRGDARMSSPSTSTP